MIKTLSFGVMHISVAFLVVWAMTGDWRIGGATALVEPCVNTVAYHFHEKVWKRLVSRKRARDGADGDAFAA
ncbi:DUF2061 domain-containing protein [Alloalcanivorax sp. C16-2]|uniref:DUF2061 domain-containing protein n=1 Tax=Alloalcanivorax TaxID=3020832 RepID=UPI00193215AB|nr:DUF2061 domain-containing protein [Alloalcanivorax marinus]MBL7251950.1 DUF2061 domain-containing protein [Alloalcanivorax marinus]